MNITFGALLFADLSDANVRLYRIQHILYLYIYYILNDKFTLGEPREELGGSYRIAINIGISKHALGLRPTGHPYSLLYILAECRDTRRCTYRFSFPQ